MPTEPGTMRCRFCDRRGDNPEDNLTRPWPGTSYGERMLMRASTRTSGSCVENALVEACGGTDDVQCSPPGQEFEPYFIDYARRGGAILWQDIALAYSADLGLFDPPVVIDQRDAAVRRLKSLALSTLFVAARPGELNQVHRIMPRNQAPPNSEIDRWTTQWETQTLGGLRLVRDYTNCILQPSGCRCRVSVNAYAAGVEFHLMIKKVVHYPCQGEQQRDHQMWPFVRVRLNVQLQHRITDVQCAPGRIPPKILEGPHWHQFPDSGNLVIWDDDLSAPLAAMPQESTWWGGRGALTAGRWHDVGPIPASLDHFAGICRTAQNLSGYSAPGIGTRMAAGIGPESDERINMNDDLHRGSVTIQRLVNIGECN